MYQQPAIHRRWIVLGLCLLGAGLTAAFFFDLSLTRYLYQPDDPPAIFMESFGFYPIYLPALLWLCVQWLRPGAWAARLAAFASSLILAGYLAYYSVTHLARRGVRHPGLYAAVVLLATAFCLGWVVRLCLAGTSTARRARFGLWCGTLYLLIHWVVIYVCKLVWNRTRFEDMLQNGDFEHFTRWLFPFGNGGTSFPSGHTAAACGVFVLVFFCDLFPGWNKRRGLVWAGCWAYVGWMALSRMMMGRHFLSDTLAASALMVTLFLLITRSNWYKRQALAVCQEEGDPNG